MGALPHLLLFDIDGTLLNTGGAGMRAFVTAFEDLYPDKVAGQGGVPDIDFAGSTDSGIVMGMFEQLKITDSSEERERFYETYLGLLKANMNASTDKGGLLNGVGELLESLNGYYRDGKVLPGLLTGNFGAYGDDHHDRNRLGPVAVQRASDFFGRDLISATVTVIGDTVKDIRCARAFGARVLAVATGSISLSELAGHEPDILLETLEDVDGVLAQLRIS